MKRSNMLKIMSIAAAALSILATIVDDWVSEKEMEAMVDDKVQEYLTKKKGETE